MQRRHQQAKQRRARLVRAQGPVQDDVEERLVVRRPDDRATRAADLALQQARVRREVDDAERELLGADRVLGVREASVVVGGGEGANGVELVPGGLRVLV
jgi:hypothetical protein